MVVIIDYGVGNLFSLESSLKAIGQDVIVSKDSKVIEKADKLILPGVGAFKDAIDKLRENNLDQLIIRLANEGKPLLGICLGMQMLFEESEEFGVHKGLGLVPGKVVPLKGFVDENLKIPHIGYNGLHFNGEQNELFKGLKQEDCVYFVHSYYASECDGNVIATVEYSKEITAAVSKGNVYGCQFHPEKSGKVGLQILKNFCQL